MNPRLALALLPPFLACGLQWLLWDAWIKPYVWFLFFPAAFFSAWLGGLRGGIAGAVIGALLVWYVFMPPVFAFSLDNPANAFSIAMFVLMGVLYGWLFERLRLARERSDTRFEATFEQAAVGIALVAPDGRWLRVNRKLCAIVGYTQAELLAKSFQDITHPDDLDAYLDQVRRMLAKEIDTYAMEKRYVRKDGAIIWINLTVALTWTPEGQPDYFISVVEDISARKAMETALRENEARLTEARHLAGLGHWHWDLRADTQVWSEEIYAIYGRDPALPPADYPEVSGYFTPPSWARLAAAVEQARATGLPYECDAEVARPDGGQRWITARGQAIRDATGQVVVLHGTVQDITDRKRSELALRDSQERLQLLIDHAPAALAMFDRDMRYLAVSQRWLNDFGLVDREILGRSHYDIFPEIPEVWKAVHRRGLAGEVITADEDRFQRANGEEHWLRWEVRPWRAHDGTVGGIVIFTEDITRLVTARRDILQLNADLERRVAERTAELAAANQELESFAYAVSHDLRAPLRAMGGFTQALLEDYGEHFQGESKTWLDQIGIASRRMGELIDGLLALSRSTRGELRRDRIDLSALARRLLDDLARADPGRQVTVDIQPGLTVMGDGRMLEAALANLLSNAWKYTGRAATPVIRVHSETRAGQPWYCVADNGAGFDMDHVARLFQPFQRLHRQDEFPGIGIGLATVQRIVHRHGGRIEARGQAGMGASICFTLDAPTTPETAP